MNTYIAEAIAKCKAPKRFEELARIIKCIFKAFERGYSLEETANRFNEVGIRSIMGARFTPNNVHRIIHVLAYQKRSHFTAAMKQMLEMGQLNASHLKELEKHKAG